MFYRYVDISITFEKANLNTEFLLIPNFSLNFIVTLILATMVLSLSYQAVMYITAKKLSFPLRIFSVNVSKSAKLWISSHLMKNSLMENFIFYAVFTHKRAARVNQIHAQNTWI